MADPCCRRSDTGWDARPRRLAYLDSTFPWMRSGFRYHEAEAILEEAPTSLFFSTFEMTDAFPAPVHPLSEFPKHALREGVTDAYGVFEYFLEGLVGMHPTDQRDPHFMEGPEMVAFLRRSGIRLHGSIYPGGGLKVTPEGLDRVRQLTGRLVTAFSYVPEVLAAVPQVVEVSQAFTETRFYAYDACRWDLREKLVCLFAAEAPPRKGADVVLDVFLDLPGSGSTCTSWVHICTAAASCRRTSRRSTDGCPPSGCAICIVRFTCSSRRVGRTCGAEQRQNHRRLPHPGRSDAMSSGCLLVLANPAGDGRVLLPGVHYLECDPDPDRLRQLVCELAGEPTRRPIADAGSARVRERMDVRRGIAEKLRLMGFAPRLD